MIEYKKKKADDDAIDCCWDIFCKAFATNLYFQQLRTLKIDCCLDDTQLASLIDHIAVYCSNLQHLHFGRNCACDTRSLASLCCACRGTTTLRPIPRRRRRLLFPARVTAATLVFEKLETLVISASSATSTASHGIVVERKEDDDLTRVGSQTQTTTNKLLRQQQQQQQQQQHSNMNRTNSCNSSSSSSSTNTSSNNSNNDDDEHDREILMPRTRSFENFCSALHCLTNMKRLEMVNYTFDPIAMQVFTESILTIQQTSSSSRNRGIKYLSLLNCRSTNTAYNNNGDRENANDQYEEDDDTSSNNDNRWSDCCWDIFCNIGLKQNRLPSLKVLLLPPTSLHVFKLLACNVLPVNTSLVYVNYLPWSLYRRMTITMIPAATKTTTEVIGDSSSSCVSSSKELYQNYTKQIKYYLDLNRGGRQILTRTTTSWCTPPLIGYDIPIPTAAATDTNTKNTPELVLPTMMSGARNRSGDHKNDNNYRIPIDILWPYVLAHAASLATTVDYSSATTTIATLMSTSTSTLTAACYGPVCSGMNTRNDVETNATVVRHNRRQCVTKSSTKTKEKEKKPFLRYDGGIARTHDVVYCLLRNRILLEL